jgi:hypothetical protein
MEGDAVVAGVGGWHVPLPSRSAIPRVRSFKTVPVPVGGLLSQW